jgi:hypothetical protein
MPSITFNIPTGNVNEIKAAIDHHIGTDATEGWDNTEYLDWVKARVRSQVKQLVLKYRESAQPAIDTTDPTED